MTIPPNAIPLATMNAVNAEAGLDLPEGYELFEGGPRKVVNADRSGWWRFNDHYDRNGYCDNPGRGY